MEITVAHLCRLDARLWAECAHRKGSFLISKILCICHCWCCLSSSSFRRLGRYHNDVLSMILPQTRGAAAAIRALVDDDSVEKLKRMLALFIWIEFCIYLFKLWFWHLGMFFYVSLLWEVNCVVWHTHTEREVKTLIEMWMYTCVLKWRTKTTTREKTGKKQNNKTLNQNGTNRKEMCNSDENERGYCWDRMNIKMKYIFD